MKNQKIYEDAEYTTRGIQISKTMKLIYQKNYLIDKNSQERDNYEKKELVSWCTENLILRKKEKHDIHDVLK